MRHEDIIAVSVIILEVNPQSIKKLLVVPWITKIHGLNVL
jgi:hypothetical protein